MSVLMSVSRKTAQFFQNALTPYQELIRALPVATALVDRAGLICHANLHFEHISGPLENANPSTSFCNLLFPEFLRRFESALDDIGNARPAKPFECRIKAADGGANWVVLSISTLGSSGLFCVQCTDINEQKEREAQATFSEERLSLALECAGQGVWDADFRKGMYFHSDTWRQMRGYEPHEDVDALAGSWFERLHPDDHDRIKARTDLQNAGKADQNVLEYRERHRDGHWMWIFSRGRAVEWFPDGTVARMLGTDIDISSLKTIESKLAEEKERLLVTLRSIAEGVISLDLDLNVALVNEAAEKIMALPAHATLSRPITDVFDLRALDGSPLTAEIVGQAVESGNSVNLSECVLHCPTGHELYLNCSISPVKTPDGAIMGMVMVFRDTTSERLVSQALAHSATHDALTGLANRYAFERSIESAVEAAQTTGRTNVLCYLDLDGFKQINDNAGHAAGDDVLRQVADILTGSCRSSDFVARLGGDEFAILLADCPRDRAETICSAIIQKISQQHFSSKNRSYSVGVSIGLRVIDELSPSASIVTEQADAACYHAKASGKGRAIVFDDGEALGSRRLRVG
jgi:diguanylate cyclase (GGDEF)-like protein/PAS domain S-box-containing protein